MPIYYACESEDQAKELCVATNGEYMGRSALYSGYYTWRTHSCQCVCSFVRPSASGDFDRFMVVYNQEAESFESILIESACPPTNSFVTGGTEDAPAELHASYAQYRYTREEAKRQAKDMHVRKAQSMKEARLRKIKSKMVAVIAGTTIKHGTTGRVFWTGYGEKGDARVGFTDDTGTRHWTSLENVCEVNDLPLLAKTA